MNSFRTPLFLICLLLFSSPALSQRRVDINWKHLSTINGDLELPNTGNQQTATLVMDADKDGVNDFFITERTAAPAVLWYRRTAKGWDRYIVEKDTMRIEAGSSYYDVDGDGDLDALFGGESRTNQIWWWENPYPNYKKDTPWKRHLVKNDGGRKHHDQMIGDVDGDGRMELVFWNQGALGLFLAEIPDKPLSAQSWTYRKIYEYSADSEMQQRGTYPAFKKINEHEGLAFEDIDGDGLKDIVGGGRWFKYLPDGSFLPNIIDASYTFSRSAAGQLIEGGRPEVVLVVGDGVAPMLLYQWEKGAWVPRVVVEEIDNGHSLAVVDFNGDGHLDIFNCEMNLNNTDPNATTRILLGDGQGNFPEIVIIEGFGLHESKIADLDGDGDLDILGKPYNWQTPRLDIWLNMGK